MKIVIREIRVNSAHFLSNHLGSSCLRITNISLLWLNLLIANSYAATIEIYPGANVFKPAAESLKPGDTLIVHEGTYLENNRMSIQVQGTAAAPILIKGADGEARPLITRPTSASLQNTINIEGSARYLTIKGLEIIGNGGDGINMSGTLSFITLEDLAIHDVDVGINFRSSMDHITVRRNHIYNTGRDGGTGEGMYVGCNDATCIVRDSIIENNWIHDVLPGTTQGDGIEIKVGSFGNIIRDNVIYNRSYPGILVYGTGANPVNVVEGNVVWNSLEGISPLSDAVVQNNIVFNSGCGLCIYSHVQVSQRKNITAVNNTLYNNDDGIYYRWSGSNLILANNAIYSPGKTAIDSSGAISSTGGAVAANYVEGAMSGDVVGGGRFLNGGTSASAFVNPAGNDFWLKTGSPLIGAANASYVPGTDFNGTTRTSPFDVGAYATNGQATNPGWKIGPGLKQIGSPIMLPAAPTNLRVQ
jgi:parallel beta-helix repeat protein